MKILDIGCGNRKGWNCPYKGEIIGIDNDPDSDANILHNLEVVPYPFNNNEFDVVYSHHCVEHLYDTMKVLRELHRITKPGGRITILIPYGGSVWGLSNPDHKKFFSHETILAIKEFREWFKVLKNEYHYIFRVAPEDLHWKGRFIRDATKPLDWVININKPFYDRIGRHYLGDADEIEWELEVIKVMK